MTRLQPPKRPPLPPQKPAPFLPSFRVVFDDGSQGELIKYK
jgi:hypothetical protein